MRRAISSTLRDIFIFFIFFFIGASEHEEDDMDR